MITATLLDSFCPPTKDRLILDAGCGTGGNIEWLRRYAGNGRITGLDLETAALLFCRERRHQDLIQGSITELPFAEDSYDLVTSFDVLVQLPGEGSDRLALREIHRVLKPGGLAFIRVAAYKWMRSSHDLALGSQRRYALSDLRRLLEHAGFNVLRETYANSFLLPIAALRRLLLKRIGLAESGSDVKPLPPQLAWLNHTLTATLKLEAQLLANPRTKLPFGLSAICVVRKPEESRN